MERRKWVKISYTWLSDSAYSSFFITTFHSLPALPPQPNYSLRKYSYLIRGKWLRAEGQLIWSDLISFCLWDFSHANLPPSQRNRYCLLFGYFPSYPSSINASLSILYFILKIILPNPERGPHSGKDPQEFAICQESVWCPVACPHGALAPRCLEKFCVSEKAWIWTCIRWPTHSMGRREKETPAPGKRIGGGKQQWW